jgi:hypothetical protein
VETSDLLSTDFSKVEAMHKEMGFDYKMPDLSSPLFVLKHAVIDDGKLVGAAALRVQAEAYLWLDTSQPVSVRYRVVLALSKSLAEAAWRVGIDCVVAWLPPGLPRSFQKLLRKLGWLPDREGWQSWTKPI